VKKFIIAVAVIAAIIIAAIAFLHLTVPKNARGVRVPLTREQAELLASVPSTADTFALIPTAGAVYGKLETNPITADVIEKWADVHHLPEPWLMGSADLLTWNGANGASYAIRLDVFRALLVRLYMMLGNDIDGRWSNSTFLINAPAETPIDAAEISRIMALAEGLPTADVLVVQRERDRSGFPPMHRPAVTSVQIAAAEIDLTTHAPADPAAKPKPLAVRDSRSAMLNATFATPPRLFDDLNRLLLTRVSPLVSDGGAVAIYDVDTGTLLPRPKGVIVLPADDARRESLQKLVHDSEGLIQTGEQNGQLLVSFDSSSIPHFASDSFDKGRFDANLWSMRLDPERLVPVLQRMGGSTGLRLAAGRLYRATRSLGSWIGPLQQARSIEAASSSNGQTEEMRVVITSK
jgi:hypothetical protein